MYPGKRRARPPRFRSDVRLSFGPSMEVLDKALGRLEALVMRHTGS